MKKAPLVRLSLTAKEAKVVHRSMSDLVGDFNTAVKNFPSKTDRLDAVHAADKLGVAIMKYKAAVPKIAPKGARPPQSSKVL